MIWQLLWWHYDKSTQLNKYKKMIMENNNCKIVTWNVNSIRSRLEHLLGFLRSHSPDVVLLQELKLEESKFPYMEIEELGYNCAVMGQKTYNGVAILSKSPLEDVRTHLYDDMNARYIEAVTYHNGHAIRVASVYVPNGQAINSDKFAYKMEFLTHLRSHMQELLRLKEILIVGGDYNIAYLQQDVYDASELEGSICYHMQEREHLRAILNMGYYDAMRVMQPDAHIYSWWDYRGEGFERGHGLRIDHLLLSPEAVDLLQNCQVVQELRKLNKPSDHAPVMCELKL